MTLPVYEIEYVDPGYVVDGYYEGDQYTDLDNGTTVTYSDIKKTEDSGD